MYRLYQQSCTDYFNASNVPNTKYIAFLQRQTKPTQRMKPAVWPVLMLVCASKNGSRWSSRIVQTLFGHPPDGPDAHAMAAARENRRQPPRLDCPAFAPHPALKQKKDNRAWKNNRGGHRPEGSIIGKA